MTSQPSHKAWRNPENAKSSKMAANQCGCVQEPLRYLARIGLWGDAQGRLRRYSPTLALAQALYGLGTQFINVALTWGKLALAAEYCVALLQILMTCVKIRCLLANTSKIQEVVATLDNMRNKQTKFGDVRDIRRRTRATSAKFARVLHNVCLPLLVIFTGGLCVAAYSKHFIPYRRWFPYDSKTSPMFELTLFMYNILTNFDLYVILLFDLLVLCLLIEVAGEFRVLQHCLTRVDQPNCRGPKSHGSEMLNEHGNAARHTDGHNRGGECREPPFLLNVGDLGNNLQRCQEGPRARLLQDRLKEAPVQSETCEQRLAACVIQHNALIRLVSKLEAMFQAALVIHLVCNFCVGLTVAFVTLKTETLNLISANMLSIGVVCVGEFAFYCYFCTQITTESTLVGESLYACAWWDASESFKRSLRIVQLRTDQPVIIRAAAIFPMSMETFTKVMNTAYNMYGLMITTN